MYDISDSKLKNNMIHLTNNAVQKNADKYGMFENGNQLSFAMFEKYIEDKKLNINFRGKIIPTMKEMIYLTYESVRN